MATAVWVAVGLGVGCLIGVVGTTIWLGIQFYKLWR